MGWGLLDDLEWVAAGEEEDDKWQDNESVDGKASQDGDQVESKGLQQCAQVAGTQDGLGNQRGNADRGGVDH